MEGVRGSLDEILEELQKRQYTGSIVVHMRGGRPEVVEMGKPSRLQIVPGIEARENILTPSKRGP